MSDDVSAAGEPRLRVGMALWGFRGWNGSLYPESTPSEKMLDRYVERFTAVEGNTFFYAVQGRETLEGWAERMPPGFRMLPKLPRAVTHEGAVAPKADAALRFLDKMRVFGPHLGPCFALLPPRYGPERFADLERFLRRWPREEAPLAIELRHPGWYQGATLQRVSALCYELGVGSVLMDARPIYRDDPGNAALHAGCKKPDLPVKPRVTAPFVIIRYVGHPALERNDRYLADWVTFTRRVLERGLDCYVFAHCPEEAQSPHIARRYYHAMREAGSALPELPWDTLPPIPKQGALF